MGYIYTPIILFFLRNYSNYFIICSVKSLFLCQVVVQDSNIHPDRAAFCKVYVNFINILL